LPLEIIAEVGSNWYREDKNEAYNACLEHIRQANKAGSTCVKFQLFRADSLYSKERMPQSYEAIKKFELPLEWLRDIWQECKDNSIKLCITPFSLDLVREAVLYSDIIKIASGDITYFELLAKISNYSEPVILSTGSSSANDVKKAIEHLFVDDLTLMYCVSSYPAKPSQYELVKFPYSDFANKIGVSDHTPGNELLEKAITLGYTVFEKHIHIDGTPDNLPDRSVSISMEQFKEYCDKANRLFNARYRGEFIRRGDEDETKWARRGKDGLRPNV